MAYAYILVLVCLVGVSSLYIMSGAYAYLMSFGLDGLVRLIIGRWGLIGLMIDGFWNVSCW